MEVSAKQALENPTPACTERVKVARNRVQAERPWKPPHQRHPRQQSSLRRQWQIDEGLLILCNGVFLLKPPSYRDAKVKESLRDLRQAGKEISKDSAQGDQPTETPQEDMQDEDVWPARKRRRHLGRCWWAQEDCEAPWNRDAAERESAASVLTQAMLSYSFVGEQEPGGGVARRRLRPARFRVEGKQSSKSDPNQCRSALCEAH
ncbi:unnamed protein product [Polarella glacialis]|uniref:Uncharacterized protein n=1 Tax=Polarella glacialis TaxID=89957 RepID=A0A813LDX6_POLGL|nr:unnamed protein product [Polarella glacialis]